MARLGGRVGRRDLILVYGGSPAERLERELLVRRRARPVWVPTELDVDGGHTLLAPVALVGDRVAFVGSSRRERRGAFDGVFVAVRRSGAASAPRNHQYMTGRFAERIASTRWGRRGWLSGP
jgi:hypothetical protein